MKDWDWEGVQISFVAEGVGYDGFFPKLKKCVQGREFFVGNDFEKFREYKYFPWTWGKIVRQYVGRLDYDSWIQKKFG